MSTAKASGSKALVILSLHIAAILVAVPGWSQGPSSERAESLTTNLKVTAGAIALGSAYMSYNNFQKSRELLKQNSTPVWTNESRKGLALKDYLSISEKVKEGDTIMIHYELSENESRKLAIKEATLKIEEQNKRILDFKQEIKILERDVFFQKQKKDIDYHRVVELQDRADLLKARIEATEMKISSLQENLQNVIRTEKIKPISQVATIDTSAGRVSDVESFLRQRMLSGNQTKTVLRIPKNNAKRLSQLRTGGVMGLMAMALGGFAAVVQVTDSSTVQEAKNIEVYQPVIVTTGETDLSNN